MTRFFMAPAPVALVATILAATPAWADLSVDDAWNTWKAQFTALGLRLEAAESRDGDTLQIGDLRLTADFPLGTGKAYLSFPGPRFAPLKGGRVAVSFPEGGHLSLGGEIMGEGSFAAAFEMHSDGETGVMSGQAGDVVSEWTSKGNTLTLVDLAVSGQEAVDITGALKFGPWSAHNTTKMTDTQVSVTTTTNMDGYSLSYEMSLPGVGGGAIKTAVSGMAGRTTNVVKMTLPNTGLDLLGLHSQLSDGLTLDAHMITDVTRSAQTMRVGDEVAVEQGMDAEDYDVTLRLDHHGLDYGGSVGASSGRIVIKDLPFPVEFAGSGVDFRLLIPLLMGEDQEAALRMGLHDITVNEGLWALIDPEGGLPRDPVTVALDMGSKVSLLFEFLDIRALIGGAEPPAIPVMAKTATLNDLRLSAAGAEVTGKGDFTFDYNDWETFDGIPAPIGQGEFTITGAHGLIDKLIAMGLIGPDEAMGARMMLGVISKPAEGNDVLTSQIEIKKAGEVWANGQRLQ